jgi:hypothetical protein
VSQTSELDSILAKLRYVKVGDIIMAEDHNDVVDALRKIRNILATVPAVPVFDYIVDIYSDKVVITAPDGTTTQLSTIADLNNWLRDITGKKIRVNVNVEVSGDMYFTPNEYWIFGERVNGTIYLLDGKHTIVSFAPLGEVTNYMWRQMVYHDISGSRLIILYADDVDISGTKDMILKDIVIAVYHSYSTSLEYAEGDMYAQGYFVHSAGSVLRNVYINAAYANFENVTTRNREGSWLVISHMYAGAAPLNLSGVYVAVLHLTDTWWISLPPQSTRKIWLPNIKGTNWTFFNVIAIGVERCGEYGCVVDPLPPGVTYTIDVNSGELIIQNNTDSFYNIDIVYEVYAFKYW